MLRRYETSISLYFKDESPRGLWSSKSRYATLVFCRTRHARLVFA